MLSIGVQRYQLKKCHAGGAFIASLREPSQESVMEPTPVLVTWKVIVQLRHP